MHLFSEEAEQAVTACKAAQAELARKEKELAEEKEKVAYRDERIKSFQHQVEFKEAQMLAKDKLLEDRYSFLKLKDRYISILSILLFVALGVIITALVIDRLNPYYGFFWRSAFESTVNPLFDNLL